MPASDLSGLQAAIYARLRADPVLANEWAIAIIDAPANLAELPESYIRLGEDSAAAWLAQGLAGHKSVIELGIYTKVDGFVRIKAIADHVVSLLTVNPPTIETGDLIGFWYHKSQSQRLQNGNLRVVRLWFRALIAGRISAV